VPPALSNVVAITAGAAHSLALRADGSLAVWGRGMPPPPGLSNLAGIAAGAYHSLALGANGGVVAWGNNRVGQCSVPAALTDVVSVTAGAFHSLALRRDGTVAAWGLNHSGQCDVPPGLSNVITIAAGGYHSLALKGDGSVVAWGLNRSGQCEPPAASFEARALAAGRAHSVAITGTGPLADALSGSALAWQSGGQQPWQAQMRVARDGALAAESGVLAPGEESWLETRVPGPGVLSFWWRLSSPGAEDALELSVNGATVARVTGTVDWALRRLALRSGVSNVRWRHARAAASPEGEAAAWLDQVAFAPAPVPVLGLSLAAESQVAIHLETLEGLPYLLQSAPALQGPLTEWAPVETVIGTGQPVSVLRPLGDSSVVFYRVVIE
jgi:hypothetical protein